MQSLLGGICGVLLFAQVCTAPPAALADDCTVQVLRSLGLNEKTEAEAIEELAKTFPRASQEDQKRIARILYKKARDIQRFKLVSSIELKEKTEALAILRNEKPGDLENQALLVKRINQLLHEAVVPLVSCRAVRAGFGAA